MKLSIYPEFGVELTLAIPFAYWLYENNMLDTVITSKGMSPFYYFCKDVREEHEGRSLDNYAALENVPNKYMHQNSFPLIGKHYQDLTEEEKYQVNGVLDYSQWKCPPYKEYYKNNEFIFNKKTVFITNKFNMEHGHEPLGYFNIKCLYDIFDYLREKDYTVIYKRPTNLEKGITKDGNEYNSIISGYHDIKAHVENVGEITDFQLCKYFDNVILFDDLIKNSKYSYNETQLKIMVNCDKFISVCGGNAILSSLFGKDVIIYVHTGKELRPNYFGPNSYFRKLSNANIMPTFDREVMKTGIHDYSELINTIKQKF